MSKYKITLTPVDKFFFGGDMTFQVGSDEKDSFNARYSSYIIESSRFPQQTSLLGMLRFLILSNAGKSVFYDNRIQDKNTAAMLIGARSFSTSEAHVSNVFGKIKSISRVRVLRGDVELDFAPQYGCIDFSKKARETMANGTYNLGFLNVPNIKYNAKEGLETLMIPISEMENYFYKFVQIMDERKKKEKEKTKDNFMPAKSPYKLSDIFIEDRRIGISRSMETGKTDDGALFKQISYRFNNQEANHCFVFDADVDDFDNDEKLTKYNGKLVSLGGDNSQFVIGITESETLSAEDNTNALAIVLLSPTFLTREEVRANTVFAVTQLMPFCFLTDKADNDDKDNRSYHILNSKLKRSEKYELYAPGTVFYFAEDNKKRIDFVKALESKKEFRQIGYNEYKSINKKERL